MENKVYKRIKIRNYFSDEIYKIRKANKMTQEQFANVLNVSKTTIANIENRKTLPEAQLLRDISTIFGDKTDSLYEIKKRSSVNYEYI